MTSRCAAFDIAQPHRPHVLDFFFEQCAGALGHIAEDFLFEFGTRRAHGHDPFVFFDFADQHLHARIVDLAEVFEGEHQLANAVGQLRFEFVQTSHHPLFGGVVDKV